MVMPSNPDTTIAQYLEDLNRLANVLEQESAKWPLDYVISAHPELSTSAIDAKLEEQRRREHYLWENTVQVGNIILKLYEAGGFDNERRIKNALGQMRSEMNRARKDDKAPLYWPGRKRPAWPGSQPWSDQAREMFLVKIVEGICKIFSQSYEDRRAFKHYCAPTSDRAALQIRVVRALSQKLMEKHGS
jgi:hypothetical protein